MSKFTKIGSLSRSLALACMVWGLSGLARAQEAQTETVTAEGVGKTEAFAKKAAFKEAIQKVVGVLVDSSTQVKNEEIIKDEVLEYSGGFVSKSETLSSKKDDEGLFRVKVKCVVEKAQVKKKLESLSVITVKVDGSNLAIKESSQAELRKNSASFISKAMIERKTCFKVEFPKTLEGIKKSESGEITFPVRVSQDPGATKKWLDNWMPVFSKMAEAQMAGVSRYTGNPPAINGPMIFDLNNPVRRNAKLMEPNRRETLFLIVGENISADYRVKWRGFKVPCDLTKLDPISCREMGSEYGRGAGLSVAKWPEGKVIVEFLDENGSVIVSDESKGATGDGVPRGVLAPFAIANDSQAIEFSPLPTDSIGSHAINPNFDFYRFVFKLSNKELEKVRSVTARIEWDDDKVGFSK
jgi:hypothetical protein